MNARKVVIAAFFFCFMILTGCGGPLYKVATAPVTGPPDLSASGSNGMRFGAIALGGDPAFEQFEANLPMAGVIAINLRIANGSTEPFETRDLKLELIGQNGVHHKRSSPKKALDRVMKYYGNSLYSIESKRLTRESYESLGLNQVQPIQPGEERSGFLFFETDRDSLLQPGLILRLKGSRGSVEIPVEIK